MKQFHRNGQGKVPALILTLIVLLLLIALVVPVAATPVTWGLSGVTLIDGGSLTGSFTYDASTNTMENWSISAAAGTTNPFLFNPSTSVADFRWGILNYIIFDYIGTTLHFIQLSTGSFLERPGTADLYGTDNRDADCSVYVSPNGAWWVESGLLAASGAAAVPEPNTLLLFGIGLVGLVGFRTKFKR